MTLELARLLSPDSADRPKKTTLVVRLSGGPYATLAGVGPELPKVIAVFRSEDGLTAELLVQAAGTFHLIGSAIPIDAPGSPLRYLRDEGLAFKDASSLVTQLLRAGYAAKTVAELVNERGVRAKAVVLDSARLWFELAMGVEPSYEDAIYNAAGVASLRADTRRALELLNRLRLHRTPRGDVLLQDARADPDFDRVRATAEYRRDFR